MLLCPCGSQTGYDQCCRPFIDGTLHAPTAEALIRSRYTAFTRVATEYLLATVHPDKRHEYKADEVERWARDSQWQSLEILAIREGAEADDEGEVEFIATYRNNSRTQRHHELATFKKKDGIWYFFDGTRPRRKPVVRAAPKVGRNESCPCGSGRKYKKCCGR